MIYKDLIEIKIDCESKIKKYEEEVKNGFNTPFIIDYYTDQLCVINNKIKQLEEK
jgi:hypothetical protein